MRTDNTMYTLSLERSDHENKAFRSASPCGSPGRGRKLSPPDMAEGDTYDIPEPLVNIGCQDLLEYKCSHCGWLRKRRTLLNNLLNWPQAYVVLHKGCLYYFKNERAKTAAGKFSLYGYNTVYRASEIPRKEAPWSMKIVHSHTEFKTYYFAAPSEKEMKVWMSCIKKEMVEANGGSSIYRSMTYTENSSLSAYQLKLAKEQEVLDEKLDDSSFYHDIETNIYEGAHKFILSSDYQKKCSIKKHDEESDDEDLIDKRPPLPLPSSDKGNFFLTSESDDEDLIDKRPPLPLPSGHEPFLTYRTLEQIAPPKHGLNPQDAPPTPPRPRKGTPLKEDGNTDKSVNSLAYSLEKVLGPPKQSKLKRRGSYEKTDDVGIDLRPSDSSDHQVDFRHMSHSEGGSTGEEDAMTDLELYWASIHFDDKDKQRAQDIINALGEDGVYLVRPEGTGTGKVLVVFSEDKAKKYRIQTTPEGEYYLAITGFHDSCLENLLCYYYQEQLPTVETKLKVPYKLHKNYKNLKLPNNMD